MHFFFWCWQFSCISALLNNLTGNTFGISQVVCFGIASKKAQRLCDGRFYRKGLSFLCFVYNNSDFLCLACYVLGKTQLEDNMTTTKYDFYSFV